nr:zinc-binding dehydrogenase [Lactobacillus amylovorus]
SDMFNQSSFTTTTVTNQQTIAVFGTGAVGLAAMMASKISGCTRVIAVDIVPSRLELAKELGATDTINSKDEDPVKKIQELTNGYGVD